jgi:hypothetical protein
MAALGAFIAFIRLRHFFDLSKDWLSLVLFTIFIATPLFEANIVNAEIFMV